MRTKNYSVRLNTDRQYKELRHFVHESRYPNIKFSSSGEKISIQVDRLVTTGEVSQAMMQEYYDKEQITEEFINERLVSLIKSCFDKNWE